MATVTLTNGNDHYTTTDNDDLVLAKGGNDQIIVKSAFYDRENDSIRIAVYGGPGNDKIIGKLGAADRQTFYGGPGNDYIEVWGSVTHNGSAIGASGNDTLVCMGGDEGCGLVGGAGDDVLINRGIDNGGHGPVQSAMFGGPGRDVMIGNSLDYFVFATGDTVAGARRDVIKNFTPGQSLDVIDLSAMDANVKVPGDQAFAFVAVTNHPGIGEVGYYVSGKNVIVIGNDGARTFEIELQNFNQPLVAADFHL